MQRICVLGATGSIGKSTLDVIARHPERYEAFALTAHTRIAELVQLCIQFRPQYAVVADEANRLSVQQSLQENGIKTEVLSGSQALCDVASHPDVDAVMAAIIGAAGLLPTLSAVKTGKKILLANKEALVMSGALFMQAVEDYHATLLPIDSEHNAIFQCMPSSFKRNLDEVGVERILLTASGGPFRNTPKEQLVNVTPEQACAHPNWSMGRKISVDSATMMNKGLEFIEACWLFNAQPEQIEVVIHPQSIIHSMVAYTDGSVLAELGNPDMRTPIAHALAWPKRIASGVAPLDLFKIAQLDFHQPDNERFPCLKLAEQAMITRGTAPAILNAANEVAVAAFLQGKIKFTEIVQLIDYVLDKQPVIQADSLETILQEDAEARKSSCNYLRKLGK